LAHRFPIKVKAVAALSVPLLLLLGVTVSQVRASAANVDDVREQADLATASIGPSGAINALMNERNYTSLWMYGVDTAVALPVGDMDGARAATDESIDAFRAEVERKGGETARIYAGALQALDTLPELRRTVDEYSGERNILSDDGVGDGVWEGYSELITTLAGRTTELAYAIEDPDLRRGVQLIDLATRQVDRISKAVRVTSVAAAINEGRLTEQEPYSRAVALAGEAERFHERILRLSTGRYEALGDELSVESDETNLIAMARDFTETQDVDILALLSAVSIEEDESYYGFVNDVSEMTRTRADELTSQAESDQRSMVGLAALALLAAGIVTWLVALSISRPLRSLTRQARDMAQRRLPQAVRSVHEVPLGEDVVVPDLEPITVRTRDEVADVADALNVVQTAALDLAVEQAVMRRNAADTYVNLARRYQDLLTRQLDAITELESGETRPGILADLYVLDHQSTRMRRNAESLLVLAGAEAHRRSEHPAAMADVVRAALGEVADYERVAVKGVQYAVVDGPVVADLAHLLAELIDNALRFSPNDEEVEVRGHATQDEYQVAVIDRGPGMAPDEVSRANRRLANAESHTVAPSTYLGLYVTAVLSARHGIGVDLQPSVNGGIVACVHIPHDVLVATGEHDWDPPPPAAFVRPLAIRRAPATPGPLLAPPAADAPPEPRPPSTPGLQVDRNGLRALRPSRATPWDMPTPPGIGPPRGRAGGARPDGGSDGNGTRRSLQGGGLGERADRWLDGIDGVGPDPRDGIDDDDDGGTGPTAADPLDTPAR
jgi:signal transduction histidine kinase